ncbi:MAG: IS1634 family transposase [Bacteroidales bacterium]|nr:IS1634 family transposase [Bacteroidales bacterium]
MFIKAIPKTDKTTGKSYTYYRLCESYRLGEKVRHRSILSLGTLVELADKKDFKLLADRIEQLLGGKPSLFACQPLVEKLAQKFYSKIIEGKLVDRIPLSQTAKNLQSVDLDSLAIENVREIGSEWMCYQAINQLGLRGYFEKAGFAPEDIDLSLMHIISRAVCPASEHATAEWLQDNTALCELMGIEAASVSHHKLYRISRLLYEHRDGIEQYLSHKTSELFDLQDKIILYDLTNTYFEGRKQNSQIAMFGNSKEKRKDAKLVTLALVVNIEGFVKYSKIYRGNIGETTTLEAMLNELSVQTSSTGRKPLVVMDAGIADEDNLKMLKSKGYDYLCVTRSKLKDYIAVKNQGHPVIITDRRNSPVELLLIEKEGIDDSLLYVRSERKAVKELSMHENFTSHFETGLNQILLGIQKKGGTKKVEKVWERIGRLKEKYSSAHRFFDIQVSTENEVVKNLTWKRIISASRKVEGVYFLRTSIKEIDEVAFWNIYNTIREIESSFRTLKRDLEIHPVFHKSDENTMAHLFLAVLAYQMVNTIRYQLKANGIHHDWSHIVRIMNTQKAATVTMQDKDDQKIYIRKCSKPEAKASEIYDALSYKHQPWIKKSVLPEKQIPKIEPPESKDD